jgi:hypothetical protein
VFNLSITISPILSITISPILSITISPILSITISPILSITISPTLFSSGGFSSSSKISDEASLHYVYTSG